MERQENYLHPCYREALGRLEPLFGRVDVSDPEKKTRCETFLAFFDY